MGPYLTLPKVTDNREFCNFIGSRILDGILLALHAICAATLWFDKNIDLNLGKKKLL